MKMGRKIILDMDMDMDMVSGNVVVDGDMNMDGEMAEAVGYEGRAAHGSVVGAEIRGWRRPGVI